VRGSRWADQEADGSVLMGYIQHEADRCVNGKERSKMEEVEVFQTKDSAGEWRDIGALMDQWIKECRNNTACVKGGEYECEFERYQSTTGRCGHPRYREIFAGMEALCCSEDELGP
jgi:hypothetical protein